ncbi:hypothetical protein [Streptosporangium sp. NPDC002607]
MKQAAGFALFQGAPTRTELEAITELTPLANSDVDEAWRAMLVNRFATVRPFLVRPCEVIQFRATAEGKPVLAALRATRSDGPQARHPR